MLKFNSFGLVLVLSAGFIGGCGTSIRDICERSVECDSRSQTVDECVELLEETEEEAEELGCGGELDDSLDCIDDNAECVDDRFVTDGCESELAALQRCSRESRDDEGSNDG